MRVFPTVLQAFIDTNIYLDFYAFAADDLEELRKLKVAIDTGDLKLWSTDQVRRELTRHREAKIAQSVKDVRKLRPPARLPQMVRNLAQFADLEQKRRAYLEAVVTSEEVVEQSAAHHSLAADSVLRELLDASENVLTTAEIVSAAQSRVAVGDPPGKGGSLGDAIHWHSLLEAVPTGNDLHLVTADGDFVSDLDSARANELLRQEWQASKSAEVHTYRSIGQFLGARFPTITLAAQFEKELKIRRLVSSASFDRTHNAISALDGYTEFSDAQAVDLLNAALDNSQISWIIRDGDVQQFFRRLFASSNHLLTRWRRARLAEDLGVTEPELNPDEATGGAADTDAAEAHPD